MTTHTVLCSFALAATLTLASAAPASTKSAAAKPTVDKAVSLELFTQPADSAAKTLALKGADARVQLLVHARHASGVESDYTSKVTYTIKPLKVVDVDKSGYLTPIGDGTATITAKSPEGLTATASVSVENFKLVPTINFANSIVPIFTKAGQPFAFGEGPDWVWQGVPNK